MNNEVKDEIINGMVFEAPAPLFHQVVVLYHYTKEKDGWMLLHISNGAHGWNVANICHYDRKEGGYNPIYTQEELQEKLKTWKRLEEMEIRLYDRSSV